MSIRKRIPELRAWIYEHDLTQQQLASKAGVSYSWLAKFAQGATPNPRVGALLKLEDCFEADRSTAAAGSQDVAGP